MTRRNQISIAALLVAVALAASQLPDAWLRAVYVVLAVAIGVAIGVAAIVAPPLSKHDACRPRDDDRA